MKLKILFFTFALFLYQWVYALNVSSNVTPCSAHGCDDGYITITVTASHCSNVLVAFPSGVSANYPSGSVITLGGKAGVYTFTFDENCQYISGYNTNGTPVYTNYNETQTISYTITEPPCNLTLSIDSIKNVSFGCDNGRISATAFTTTCSGHTPWYKAKLFRNGNLHSTLYAISGNTVHFNNLDSASYYVQASTTDPPFPPCCYLDFNNYCYSTSNTIHISEDPCPLSISIDSVINSVSPSVCPSGKLYFTVNNAVECNGLPTTYFYQIYKNGNAYTDMNGNSFSGSQINRTTLDAATYYIVSNVASNPSCADTSNSFTITTPPCGSISIDFISKPCDSLSNNGEISFAISPSLCGLGGSRSYIFYKNDNFYSSDNIPLTSTNLLFNNLGTGVYKLYSFFNYSSSATCNLYSGLVNLNAINISASTLTDSIKTCQFATNQTVTYTGYNGSPPYTFSYTINGGSTQTITTTAGSQSVSIPIVTASSGTFLYNLISVADAQCNKTINDTCVVIISPKPIAHIFANTINVCQLDNEPIIKFTASGGHPPYCFKYTINGVQNSIICPNAITADSIFVPTTQADTLVYKLIEVQDSSCSFPMNDSVKVVIKKKPFVSAFPVIGCSFDTITLQGYPAGGIYNPSSPYIGPPIWYTYSITENGCTSIASATVSHYLSCSYISYEQRRLCIRMFLSGYYSGYGKMNEALINQLNITDPGIADSIDLELRDTLPPYNLIASTRAALDTNGYCCCTFTSLFITGYYYLVVKSRNGLETWSSIPIHISAEHAYYNFAESAAAAFGNNQAEVENGIWAIYTGDLNQDGNIDLLDMIGLENDISDFLFGYYSTDLNGDGNIDLLDLPILEGNVNDFIFSIHP